MSQPVEFVVYPGIDNQYKFPPAVREALASAPEFAGTFVRFEDLNGNPISLRQVVIKVDTSTWEIADIVAEA